MNQIPCLKGLIIKEVGSSVGIEEIHDCPDYQIGQCNAKVYSSVQGVSVYCYCGVTWRSPIRLSRQTSAAVIARISQYLVVRVEVV